jgi:hypothetical protein
MNKWIKLLLGLLVLNATVLVCLNDFFGFRSAALTLLKGGVVWIVFFIGILLIFLGITELKE